MTCRFAKRGKMKYDVITLGGAVVDAFVETDVAKKKGMLSFPAGEKILMDDLEFYSGGGGTNTAAAFSKMGLKTGCIVKLGKDNNAKIVLEDLKKFGVYFLGVHGKEATGFSVILVGREKSRTILQEKGANDNLFFRELELGKLNTKWFYFSSSVGKTLQTQKKLASWAQKKGIKIAYNPSSYLTEKGAGKLKSLLKNVNVLILNKEEAKDLVGKKNTFDKLRKLGPEIVCITDGAKGNRVSDGLRFFTSISRKIKVIERTGAGDAFASGFIAGLIKTGKIEEAVRIGSANAESVIRVRGAKNGLLSWRGALKDMKKIKIVLK